MKTKILVILTLSVILLTFASCEVSQADYDKVVLSNDIYFRESQTWSESIAEQESVIMKQEKQIDELTAQLSQVKPPAYFPNRTAIENWLKTVKKLGISEDSEQWLQYALYYQQKALEKGFIISVSYTIDDGISVTCDIITEDGWIYFFNPDDCELQDTMIRVDMLSPDKVEASATGVYQ